MQIILDHIHANDFRPVKGQLINTPLTLTSYASVKAFISAFPVASECVCSLDNHLSRLRPMILIN